MPKDKLPLKFNRWKKKFNMWFNELKIKKVNAYDACLNFVLQNKDVDKTLIGIDDFEQFKDIFKDKPILLHLKGGTGLFRILREKR